jgi:archaemetzincin
LRSKTRSLLAGLLAATALTLLAAGAKAETQPTRIIYIQPMGKALPQADVALVKKSLEIFTSLPVKLLPRVKLPKMAWYPPRRRWRAEKLLRFLGARMPKDGFRILGLTAADISTTKGKHKDWGVLGLANLAGTACVISSLRCHRRSRGKKHARIRLAKVAVHEIGHTLGLDHCPTRGCLLEDARGKVKTTDREYDMCPRCRAKLRKRGYALPAKPKIPWPKP